MESLSRAGQEMSLAALKQHDPYITSIADLTGQVALYTFCPKANQWVSEARRGGRQSGRGRLLKGPRRKLRIGGGGARQEAGTASASLEPLPKAGPEPEGGRDTWD